MDGWPLAVCETIGGFKEAADYGEVFESRVSRERSRNLPGNKARRVPFMKMKEIYKSKVYTERPDYADFDAPAN